MFKKIKYKFSLILFVLPLILFGCSKTNNIEHSIYNLIDDASTELYLNDEYFKSKGSSNSIKELETLIIPILENDRQKFVKQFNSIHEHNSDENNLFTYVNQRAYMNRNEFDSVGHFKLSTSKSGVYFDVSINYYTNYISLISYGTNDNFVEYEFDSNTGILNSYRYIDRTPSRTGWETVTYKQNDGKRYIYGNNVTETEYKPDKVDKANVLHASIKLQKIIRALWYKYSENNSDNFFVRLDKSKLTNKIDSLLEACATQKTSAFDSRPLLEYFSNSPALIEYSINFNGLGFDYNVLISNSSGGIDFSNPFINSLTDILKHSIKTSSPKYRGLYRRVKKYICITVINGKVYTIDDHTSSLYYNTQK